MDVQHDASGQYACTVTTESPIYSKTSESHDLTVISKQIACYININEVLTKF